THTFRYSPAEKLDRSRPPEDEPCAPRAAGGRRRLAWSEARMLALLAATNKCLATSSKSRTGSKTTKKRTAMNECRQGSAPAWSAKRGQAAALGNLHS